MTEHKLKIKIGPHEFEAQGDKESVQEQLHLWSELIKSFGKQEPTPDAEKDNKPDVSSKEDFDTAPNQKLNKIFIIDEKNQYLTLKYLPFTESKESDAFLLILYGHKTIFHKDEMLVTDLKWTLEKSGVAVVRVDRLASKCVADRLVLKRGTGKGGRYAISNTGMVRAAEIAADLFKNIAS